MPSQSEVAMCVEYYFSPWIDEGVSRTQSIRELDQGKQSDAASSMRVTIEGWAKVRLV